MSEDQFTKLFKYVKGIDEKTARIEESMATRDDIRKILNLLDDFRGKHEISDDERLVMGHQLERLDRWVHQLAKEIDYKLTA